MGFNMGVFRGGGVKKEKIRKNVKVPPSCGCGLPAPTPEKNNNIYYKNKIICIVDILLK